MLAYGAWANSLGVYENTILNTGKDMCTLTDRISINMVLLPSEAKRVSDIQSSK